MQQLTDLIDSLIAANPTATGGWAWTDPDNDAVFVDCTSRLSDGKWMLEAGDGYASVQLELPLNVLQEIHRNLTIQLAVNARQQSA